MAMQKITEEGLTSTVGKYHESDEDDEQRYTIVGGLNARQRIDLYRAGLEDMYQSCTPQEVHDKLQGNDVSVTNQKDKKYHLPKIPKLNNIAIEAKAAANARDMHQQNYNTIMEALRGAQETIVALPK